MDLSTFIPLLSLGTLLIVAVVALISRSQTKKRQKDPDAKKSRLASDAPNR